MNLNVHSIPVSIHVSVFAVSVFNCTHYNSLIWCSKIKGTFISKVRKNYISDKFDEITVVGAMTLQ